jgi:hypothetical protein
MKHPSSASPVRGCATRRGLWFGALAWVCLVQPLTAQTSPEWSLDVRPFGAILSLAAGVRDGVLIGAAIGGGIDVLDRTLAPDPAEAVYHSFEQLVHLNVFLRQKPTQSLDLDLGLRVGVGGVRECLATDCWPGAFAGLYGSVFWGTSRIKLGPRVLWALARERGTSDPVLYAELLSIRFTF